MNDINLSNLTNEELVEQLYQEFEYHNREELARVIRKELPKRYIYRIISKLYRLRRMNK